MANGGADGDGAIGDIPWTAAFDPSINVRALGEIQARGFRAASDVVDRFVRVAQREIKSDVERDDAPADPPGSGRPESTDSRALPDVDQVLGAWQKLIGQVTGSLRGVANPLGSAATVDLSKAAARGQVLLEAAEPGAVSTEVWLHNGGPDDLGKVRLRCSDLLAADGAVISAAAVRVEPDIVPMVGRSSRGVTMEVDVPRETKAGSYRGTLLVDGHPDVWLPVVLIMTTPSA